MFLGKLKLFFLIFSFLAFFSLIYLWYQDYTFEKFPLKDEIKERISKKKRELQNLAYQRFGVSQKIPVIISNKMPTNLYGMATINDKKNIIIYLNKKRFKESSNYMIDDVLVHEYAHALMFVFNDFTKENGGHTKKWQTICRKLNGIKCDRFVNTHDIVIGKTKFLYDW